MGDEVRASACPAALSFAAIFLLAVFFAFSGLKPWMPRLDLSGAPLTHLTLAQERIFSYSLIYGKNRPVIFGSSELSSPAAMDHDPNHFKTIFSKYASPVTPLVLGSANAHDFYHLTLLSAGVASTSQPIFIFIGAQHFGAPSGLTFEHRDLRWDGTSQGRFAMHLDQDMLTRAAVSMPSSLISNYAKQALRFVKQGDYPVLYRYLRLEATGRLSARFVAALVAPILRLRILALDTRDFVLWAKAYLAGKTPRQHTAGERLPLPTPDQLEATEPLVLAAAREISRTNDYGIYDAYWTKYMKSREDWIGRKVPAGSSGPYLLKNSAEWPDFILLCKLIKERHLNVVMVIPPVHGRLYSALGYDMSGIPAFYARIAEIAKSNGIPLLSLGDHSNDLYWLRDPYHHGWLSNIRYYRLMYNHFHLGEAR